MRRLFVQKKAICDNWLTSANGWMVIRSNEELGGVKWSFLPSSLPSLPLSPALSTAKCAEPAIKGGVPIITPSNKFAASGVKYVCVLNRRLEERERERERSGCYRLCSGRLVATTILQQLRRHIHFACPCNVSLAQHQR